MVGNPGSSALGLPAWVRLALPDDPLGKLPPDVLRCCVLWPWVCSFTRPAHEGLESRPTGFVRCGGSGGERTTGPIAWPQPGDGSTAGNVSAGSGSAIPDLGKEQGRISPPLLGLNGGGAAGQPSASLV